MMSHKINQIEQIESQTNSSNEVTVFSPKIAYVIEPEGVKFEEAKRVIAIAYNFSTERNTIEYGASIFRRENEKNTCVKSQIRQTAIERLKKSPVIFNYTFENSDSDKKIMYDDLVNTIRKKIYFNGVKSNTKSIISHYSNEQLEKTIQIVSKQLNSQIKEKKNKIKLQTNIFQEESQKNISENKSKSKQKSSPKNISENKSDSEKKSSPIISYVCEPNNSTWSNARRIIAIVCSYDDNSVRYGASIFRRDDPSEVCSKATIKQTALARFNSNPINLNFELNDVNSTNKKHSLSNIIKFIRTNMHQYGVKSKDVICEK